MHFPLIPRFSSLLPLFFFNDTATTEIYTLSLHDALPIYGPLVHIQSDVIHSLHGGASFGVSVSARSLSSAFVHQALLLRPMHSNFSLPIACPDLDYFRFADNSELFIRAGNRILEHGLDYFFSRIDGVKVMPTSNPSGAMKRLTFWPHGSFLFLISIRYPRDSRCAVAVSTLSTSNSSHACVAGVSSGQQSLPKQDCAA